MSNFEYIIASLPFLTADYKYADGQGFATVLEEIREDLSDRDKALLDFLLKGFEADSLTDDFYAEALSHRCRFIREFFRFDLNLRNAKVRYLNRELGRPEDQDVMTGLGKDDDKDLDIDLLRFRGGEFEEASNVEFILSQKDLLTREKGLDKLVWEKADRLSTFHDFDIEAVLAYIVKLHIADRWLVLDPETGREHFRQLVREVRGTFKGVEYKDSQNTETI